MTRCRTVRDTNPAAQRCSSITDNAVLLFYDAIRVQYQCSNVTLLPTSTSSSNDERIRSEGTTSTGVYKVDERVENGCL